MVLTKWEDAHNSIRARFEAQVTAPLGLDSRSSGTGSRIQYDNQEFVKPQDQIWVRVTILNGHSAAKAIGSQRFRNPGVMIAQIFGPIGDGDRDQTRVADTIRREFRAVTDGDVSWHTPSQDRVGRDDNWYQINVNCPFYWDETS